MSQQAWAWRAFSVSALAYLPLVVGALLEPDQINVSSWGLWVVLAGLFTWSAWAQGHESWRMALGYFLGNITIVLLALYQGGYTLNLGLGEVTVIFTLVVTTGFWGTHGLITRKQKPAILYFGCIAADVLSFYPQIKQYWGPNDTPWLALGGWLIIILGVGINLFLAEEFLKKVRMPSGEYERTYGKARQWCDIIQESAFSLDQFVLVPATLCVMAW